MEIKRLVIDMQKRMKRHSNYLKILDKMEKKIPWATQEELHLNDNKCAVCWDVMEKARRLPCSHMFHQLDFEIFLNLKISFGIFIIFF